MTDDELKKLPEEARKIYELAYHKAIANSASDADAKAAGEAAVETWRTKANSPSKG